MALSQRVKRLERRCVFHGQSSLLTPEMQERARKIIQRIINRRQQNPTRYEGFMRMMGFDRAMDGGDS